MKNKLLITLIVPLLFLIPIINYGQAPTLGTSANFALFTSIGAVTNVGTSHVTGNVGSNVGPSTGFGNVNGNMLNNNGATALCAADLLTAYNQLNTTTPGFFPASPLGNGAVLTAGVYSLSGNSILSNTLILNAQGNSSAVFIFLINGTFSSNTNAVITLSNNAQACNVFWKVEGAVGLSTGTSFKGTIIANNAAISMSSSVTLEGRALSTTGAVSVDNVLVYTPLGCNAPILNGPAAPALASAACYAIFSANGAVTNVGVTTVTGDIGSNNGLTTGYNPLLVVGAIHPIPDLSTAQCSLDLGNVYTYLNTLPTDIILLYPAQFGNNLVLTPHTYLMNGAVTLTDSLYLNAQGNANAVFVIQVNGAFSTSVNSKIILINGTQAKNVFWKIDGALSINGNSISKGTFIVNNAAIILATGVNLNGRILTTTGALSTFASTVNIPPSIGISGATTDQTVCAGSTVVFSVSSTGGTGYQWRKGTTNLINGGNISGATSGTLTINPVNGADAANNYNLVITGGCAGNYTTTNISLVVSPAPTISTSISNQTVCIGSSVVFSVSVANAITYQWRKGTTNLINGGAISGATSGTLTINPVAALDAATNYNLIITGTCGSNYTSTNISLAVNNSPSITGPINNQIVCSGGSASFSVAPNASGYTYQWRKGTVNVVNGANITGANSATLIINPVSYSDTSSVYNLIINGLCTTNFTSANVSLIVNASPTITAAINDQTVCVGNSANFIASTSGVGLTYQWRKGTVNLFNGANISGATSATLVINPVNPSDSSSNYNVVISGLCSPSYTSTNISLLLSSSPVILVSALNQTVCVGSPAGFSVSTSGSGYTYRWRNGTANLNNSATISGANSPTLTINPTALSDSSSNYNLIIVGACATNYTSSNISLAINSTQNPIINSNFSVCVGKPIILSAQTISSATYDWTGPNSYSSNMQNPSINSAVIEDAGTYSLVITNNTCKSAVSTVTVLVDACLVTDFYIPEGYSPNGDNINDVFVIRGIGNFPNNIFVIFNRWGEKIFEASPYQNNWNGKATMGVRIGGDDLPVGTYFYILDLKDGTPVFKGTIYLNR